MLFSNFLVFILLFGGSFWGFLGPIRLFWGLVGSKKVFEVASHRLMDFIFKDFLFSHSMIFYWTKYTNLHLIQNQSIISLYKYLWIQIRSDICSPNWINIFWYKYKVQFIYLSCYLELILIYWSTLSQFLKATLMLIKSCAELGTAQSQLVHIFFGK